MKNAPDHLQTAQRVKVGMIGLVAVILLIAVASAILGSAGHRSVSRSGADGAAATNALAANVSEVNEPLVDLGVAPSTGNAQVPAAAQ